MKTLTMNDVRHNETMEELKRRIFERYGIPPDDQLLLFHDKKLHAVVPILDSSVQFQHLAGVDRSNDPITEMEFEFQHLAGVD